MLVGLTGVVLIYFIGARIFAFRALGPARRGPARADAIPISCTAGWPWTTCIPCRSVLPPGCCACGVSRATTPVTGVVCRHEFSGHRHLQLHHVIDQRCRSTSSSPWRSSGPRWNRPLRWWLIAAAGFAWPLFLLIWFVFHPEVIVETLTRYGLNRGVAAPWPVGAAGSRARNDVADGALVRPGFAVLVVLRSRLPVSDRRLRQRRQFHTPRRACFPLPFIALIPIGAAAHRLRDGYTGRQRGPARSIRVGAAGMPPRGPRVIRH